MRDETKTRHSNTSVFLICLVFKIINYLQFTLHFKMVVKDSFSKYVSLIVKYRERNIFDYIIFIFNV